MLSRDGKGCYGLAVAQIDDVVPCGDVDGQRGQHAILRAIVRMAEKGRAGSLRSEHRDGAICVVETVTSHRDAAPRDGGVVATFGRTV